MRPAYSDAWRSRAVELVRQGNPIRKAQVQLRQEAADAGEHDLVFDPRTISSWAAADGVTVARAKRRFNRKAILRDIQSGRLTYTDIAGKHGCSVKLVSNIASGKVSV